MSYTDEQITTLLRIAKASIAHGFLHDAPLHVSLRGMGSAYAQQGAGFVSFFVKEELRGCMGYAMPQFSLFDTVRLSAFRAVFRDVRYSRPGFAALSMGRIQLHLFTLVRGVSLQGYEYADECIVSGETVHVSCMGREATLLAITQRDYRDKRQFLEACMQKAGIPLSTRPDALTINLLTTATTPITSLSEIGELDHERHLDTPR